MDKVLNADLKIHTLNKSKQYAAMTPQCNEILSCTYKKKIEHHTTHGGLDHYDMFTT